MKRLQMILKAKNYLELLSHSIDPTTQEDIEDSVLQKREIKYVFQYVVSILDELIENEGEIINVAEPVEFTVDKIDKNRIAVSDQPVQIVRFCEKMTARNLNGLCLRISLE